MKIKDLQADERPREKLLARGAGALSNGELLAVLLRSGTREQSALDLARQLLGKGGGRLSALYHFSTDRLLELPGIGAGKAASILAAFELGRRFLQEETSVVQSPVTSSRRIYELMIPQMKGLPHEECWILLLNSRFYLLDKLLTSSGGRQSTVIDVPQIIRLALDKGAAEVILVHNHPDGNPTPGPADVQQTDRLRKGLNAVGLKLMDHVVVCDDCFFSFADARTYRAFL